MPSKDEALLADKKRISYSSQLRPLNKLIRILKQKSTPSGGEQDDGLLFWRERILFSMIVTSLLLFLIAYIPSLIMAVRSNLWALALFDTAIIFIFLGILFSRKIKFEYRAVAALAIAYLIGIVVIVNVGMLSGGPAWLFCTAVLTGALLGLKFAFVIIIINAVTVFTIGWMMQTGILATYQTFFPTIERAIASGANFIFLNAIATISVAILVRGLQNTARKKEFASEMLKRERLQLIETRQNLRREIEERRSSTKALRESEERYRLLAENVSDVIWTIDADMKFTYISPSIQNLVGYSAGECLGLPLNTILAADSYAFADIIIKQIVSNINENGGQPFDLPLMEFEMSHKDGSSVWAEVQCSFLTDRDRRVIGLVGVARDISRRKEVEGAFRESETKYRTILESIEEGYYEVDLDGNFTLINNSVCGILGYSRDELENMNYLAYTSEQTAPKLYRIFSEVYDTGQSTKIMEHEFIRENGEIRFLEMSASLKYDDSGKPIGFRGVVRDVTERRIAEREKELLEAQLQQAQKMKAIGTLAGGVAHDLNNVLSGVVSYPDLILMDLPQDSPLRESIQIIQDSGKKAAAIVQDLLTLARRGVAISEIVNLNEIIAEYLASPELNKLRSFHPGVVIETHLDASPLNVMGSPIHLSKTIMNLVSNAAEAMPEGGKITLRTENRYIDQPVAGYDTVEEGDYLVLTISDAGIGIGAEEINRIFEPFYTKKVMGRSGTGLGMAVVWGTVKDHKGYIHVESVIGKGTSFDLYFPVTHVEREEKNVPESFLDYKGRGQSILVIDDVQQQREIAKKILTQLGYRVATAPSGKDAVKYMASHQADLLILDMIMPPGIDGCETFRRIKKHHPDQRAIITSGFSETDRVKITQNLGAGQYVKKPYTIEKIGMAVQMELQKCA